MTALAERASAGNAVLIVTAAYTGMRWGELAGLQWSRVDLDKQEIHVDACDGARHELHGKLHLGPPKTPACVRTVHLPKFLAELLAGLRCEKPTARFVFTGQDGGLHRRSNFRRWVWLPAVRGDSTHGWAPIKPHMHFHDLRIFGKHNPAAGRISPATAPAADAPRVLLQDQVHDLIGPVRSGPKLQYRTAALGLSWCCGRPFHGCNSNTTSTSAYANSASVGSAATCSKLAASGTTRYTRYSARP